MVIEFLETFSMGWKAESVWDVPEIRFGFVEDLGPLQRN